LTTDRFFLDASYAIALVARGDQHHGRAVELSGRIEVEQIPVVTTAAVVLEIGNALSRARLRPAAASLLETLHSDPLIEVVPLSDSLYREGINLFLGRPDKEWSLTDCISFVLMRERGITDALTADDHFRQAGFRALMQS
jgi:uncharacterized protein